MTLLEPSWLVLLIPSLLIVLWGRRRFSRPLWILKTLFVGLVVLALARPAIVVPHRGATLVVLVDRSASMPPASAEAALEILERLESSGRRGDRLAVLTFGARTAVESAPGSPFQGFRAEVGAEASDLHGALDAALELLPSSPDLHSGGSNRLLVLSDGRFTGTDPAGAGARAALRGVAVDYRLLERSAAGDLAVERLEAPSEVSPGEGFAVSAWVRSPARQEIEVELRRGGRPIARGRRSVPAGRSRFTFRDRAGPSGVASYSLVVNPVAARESSGGADDPLPENNTGRFLVGSRGPRPVLVVSGGATRTADLLRSGGLEVLTLAPAELAGTVEELASFSSVVLENVPAAALGELALENLAAWVRTTGGGLFMSGGRSSFGPGGYFRSPIEDVLPVSMELRQEHRKMALAMVVVLDRSGSMAAPVAGGRTKMDLANLATAEVLELLTPIDELGVVAVDSSPHLIVPLAPVTAKDEARYKILRIASQGGGIFVYTGLRSAADQLLRAEAGARHVLLFADAADAEEPGDYMELLEHCRQSKITVSVVGLGEPDDRDAAFLRDIAHRGGGRIFFTSSPESLPRIFTQDTFMVARSTFVEQPTPVRFTAGFQTLSGQKLGTPPPLGGYNLTYLRPGAHLAAVTVDEYEAPVVAAWQAGLGRAVVYTGEIDGADSGPIAGWPGIGELVVSLSRWAAGGLSESPWGGLVTQDLRRGALRVRLHLDPERTADPFTETPLAKVLRGVPGRSPVSEESPLRWIDPDTLEAMIALGGDEVAISRVEVPGLGGTSLMPVRLPYGPEYEITEPGTGHRALERLARQTGGCQRFDAAEVWDDFERRPRWLELRPWLLWLGIVLLLAEILERRTGLLSGSLTGVWERARWPSWRHLPRVGEKRLPQRVAPKGRRAPVDGPAPLEDTAPQAAPSREGGGILSALNRAKKRAGRRTGR